MLLIFYLWSLYIVFLNEQCFPNNLYSYVDYPSFENNVNNSLTIFCFDNNLHTSTRRLRAELDQYSQ